MREERETRTNSFLDNRRRLKLLKLWFRFIPKLREDNFFEGRQEKAIIHQFRMKRLGRNSFSGWIEVAKQEKKSRMIEKDKTQYLNKVNDWLKEYEISKKGNTK